jgi:type IV pilus assembly protein PilF
VLALQAGCAAEGAGSAGSEATPSMASRTTERAGPATSSNRSNPGNSGAGDSSPRTDLVTALDETDASKRSRIRLELASAYFSQGQTSTALDEVKRALSADPSSVPAYNLRGLIYATLGETILADDSFRRALALQPNEPDVLHNQGWYLCNQKRFADARIAFNTALAQLQYRDRAKTFLAQGVCEARGGDMNAAEKALLRSFELDAGNPATSINLSEVLLKKGDLDRARFYVQRINNMPQYANAETLWLAARIEHKRGNADAVDDLGAQLRARYPGTRQTSAFEQGQFNE